MEFPSKIRGLRLLATITGIYGIVWIATEGELYRAVIMAFLATALALGSIIQRYLGGKIYTAKKWISAMSGLGLLFGVSTALLTLVFMIVKTGLHGHGPEFTQDQLVWIVGQIPLWGIAGLIGGLGLGLITSRRSAHD